MNAHNDTNPRETAAQAVERVLRAERDADTSIAQARGQAQALLESAREDGLAIVNRSMERIARWQHAHDEALKQRLQALRAHAVAIAGAQRRPDESTMVAAVRQVADLLTAAADRGPSDSAR